MLITWRKLIQVWHFGVKFLSMNSSLKWQWAWDRFVLIQLLTWNGAWKCFGEQGWQQVFLQRHPGPKACQTPRSTVPQLIKHFKHPAVLWIVVFSVHQFFSIIILILADCSVLLLIINYIQQKLGVWGEKQTHCSPACYFIPLDLS